jgi:hypothetical protein
LAGAGLAEACCCHAGETVVTAGDAGVIGEDVVRKAGGAGLGRDIRAGLAAVVAIV